VPFILFGLFAGGAIEWWRLRPPGPFVPAIVAGLAPESSLVRAEDQHVIRTWKLPEPADVVASRLQRELSPSDGWQPPLLRSNDPKTIQFARVHAPNGDFQFTRVTVTDLVNGGSTLTIDDEPKQAHAFR